jgi:hypothetical protein
MRRGEQVDSWLGGGGGEGQCLTCYEGNCYFHLLFTFFDMSELHKIAMQT